MDDDSAANRRVIGVGASAGGLDALVRLVRRLPEDLAAPMLVVLHLAPNGRSLLPQILARQTGLTVVAAEDGMPLEPGVMFVAVPDRHLLVRDGHIRLERGPKENNARPAVDLLFRSLAFEYGTGAVAVVLSGALGDGSSGARAVAAAGGTVLVQDPDDATVPSMPEATLAAVGLGARTLRADALGFELGRLAREPLVGDNGLVSDLQSPYGRSSSRPAGPPTALSCPECHGPLWQVEDDRYRCRIGHAYTEDALVGAQSGTVESAIWIALETLEERAELLQKIADRHGGRRPELHTRLQAAADDAMARADLLRRALAVGGQPGADAFDVAAEATG